ncbi:methylated-DNA--[protein]-cysteine S-methyltransferase [Gloeobacter kilaueensis]|uniref:Methylated-DNA--protein-cysteine methyltransferase n=1 Tax=Gloeobacter kilaueensis (strain ATCC BAA-2537 / CCAP 1431/1 / ULC 316 / JS1) TaxID=1183438 RepID=U5QKY2_GLOK1|nr:methylated-DNA--[protein]-cysteine S-methyltransferase [Gloeobacter kilaueensis]AGY59652.1 methylated-DNA-[protein]-cysteine S-methyltransferase [Gloeobacter kilaueensis JS1]
MSYQAGIFETPLAPAVAVVDDRGALVQFFFAAQGSAEFPSLRGMAIRWNDEAIIPVVRQVGEYFENQRRHFDLPLAPMGSPFQKAVWAELTKIPFGTTMSYGELAARIGQPGGARAVGRANATNPIALVVPCHRVIGADGTLTGYAGGLPLKRALLEHEGVHRQNGQLELTGPLLPC